ncbi:MAG: bifunctional salicylyl-CoA 5-hydroxylase/oxidoreductase [Kordiimonadaceae bacterium]|jgi:anthraniloyl-CoA monooxygenase|nr:bifunctional salicylyl-CoA 5-hydroxylase/oxidoreductase [Kordiimonadaceae bacterium]MBT6036376.1 bifunctional salicylyl-CoA 5-hydroxylase/oxidoreductase [Kordiimonadaceae bacterium]MBT7582496.1 bifunctional salicylyl-CoA 5-hydroxylase/oxidoreductase [Kordiimonadaceae bacterium]
MKISVIGGGPGGLYFALLTKKAKPDWDIEVFEQNRPDDTFGFGVVFSDDTLDEFLSRDPGSYELIRDEFAYWDDIIIRYKGEEVRCTGNGFAGCSRLNLLKVLQNRCQALGVKITYEHRINVETLEQDFADSDMILASDGISSAIREHYKEYFNPSVVQKTNRFTWMGSTRKVEDFTYFFKDSKYGPICAHTYQYEEGMSTWVFEMSDECWQKWQFEEFNEQGSADKLEEIFAEELEGHNLIINRSMWRQFPRIYCNNWHYKNIAILGDAKASAHFSIGSGSKLAMECAISLSDAIVEQGEVSVDKAFEQYVKERETPVQILQHNADVSLAWFEHMDRSWDMDLMQFASVVMCRSKSITYDNLIVRDPQFVEKIDDAWYERYYQDSGYDYRQSRPTPMFTKFKLGQMELRNRVVMSPMAQYSAGEDGNLTDWHLVHYGGAAKGGMALVYVEMTCPSPEARITRGCPGLWTNKQEEDWKKIVDFVHGNTETKICMQLGHAGRKGSTQRGWEKMDYPIEQADKNWSLISASELPYFDGISQTPKAMDREDMEKVIADFRQATIRADRAGFDMIEMHAAHGYLIASFLSPLTNIRSDEYGGSIENRARFPLEVFEAMRVVWPDEKPMSVRISASDWHEGGITEEDTFYIANAFKDAGVDLIDVSAGQTVPDQKPVYGRMFQLGFAEAIRNVPRVATMAVGNITEPAQVNTILHTRRADLVAIGRPHLWNPYFMRDAAAWYGAEIGGTDWEKQYLTGKQQAYSLKEKSRAQQLEWQQKAKPSRHN